MPEEIQNKKATINVRNESDKKCFKYSILEKYIKSNSHRLSKEYDGLNDKYNFSNLTVLLKDVNIFKRQNRGVSINVYGFQISIQTIKNDITKSTKKICKSKTDKYIITPITICDIELSDDFDILFFNYSEGKYHYCLISDLSRLVSSQLNACGHSVIICRRCLTIYKKTLINEKLVLEHKKKCSKNKLLKPIIPNPDT